MRSVKTLCICFGMRWSQGTCDARLVVKPTSDVSGTPSLSYFATGRVRCNPELPLMFFSFSHGFSCHLSNSRTRACKSAFPSCYKTINMVVHSLVSPKGAGTDLQPAGHPGPSAEPQVGESGGRATLLKVRYHSGVPSYLLGAGGCRDKPPTSQGRGGEALQDRCPTYTGG